MNQLVRFSFLHANPHRVLRNVFSKLHAEKSVELLLFWGELPPLHAYRVWGAVIFCSAPTCNLFLPRPKDGDPHSVGRDPQVYQQLTSEVRRWYLESKFENEK
jgi:hypothetical protein